MIIKKRKIAAVTIALMIVGSSASVMGNMDTTGKCSDVMKCNDIVKCSDVMKCTSTEVEKALSEVRKALAEVNKIKVIVADKKAAADAATAKARAEANAAKAAAEVEAAKAKAAAEVATVTANAQVDATTATTEVDVSKARAEANAAKVAVEVEAAKAVTEAASEPVDFSIFSNVVTSDLSTYVVDPNTGDRIATTFDPENKITNISIICSRKDAPNTYTATSPSGTAALITADNDIFNCDAGYYGNSISEVSLSPEYKSSLKIELKNSSEMTGKINNNNKIQNVVLTLDKTSKWIVKGTSYLSILENEDKTLSNIIDNGNTIYYDSSDDSNSWLSGKTYKLSGGGELIPLK